MPIRARLHGWAQRAARHYRPALRPCAGLPTGWGGTAGKSPDQRTLLFCLPEWHVAVAATLAARRCPVYEWLVGTGWCPCTARWASTMTLARTLGLPRPRQAVFYRLGHLDLLADEGVARQLQDWMQDH